MTPESIVALRIDDIGASTKKYEIYSHWGVAWRQFSFTPGNFLFLKYIEPFRAWGPYREMTPEEWEKVFELLQAHNARLTVGITATWVEDEDALIPFPRKFPSEAAVLYDGVRAGLIEVANHGLTHCVLQDGRFKPRPFSSNRKAHREFWDWLPASLHAKHIRQAQDILCETFHTDIVTLVPPGNLYTDATLDAARKAGIRYVSCETARRIADDLVIVGNSQTLAFHDRELVLETVEWLQTRLEQMRGKQFVFVRELGEMIRTGQMPLDVDISYPL